jgi:hypothetical protein
MRRALALLLLALVLASARAGELPKPDGNKVAEAGKQKFWIPRKLVARKIAKSGIGLTWRKEDADEVPLVARNGFQLQTEARCADSTTTRGGPLDPTDGNDLTQVFQVAEADFAASVIVTVFQYERTGPHGMREGRSEVLWSKTYEVKLTKEEVKALLAAPGEFDDDGMAPGFR